jgi:hypothetical protein
MSEPTKYEILGVARNAPEVIIKSAYRAHAKLSHPDVQGDTGVDFKAISDAYDALIDPIKRAEYDKKLDAQTTERDEKQPGAEAVDPDSFEDMWGSEDSWTPEYEYEATDFANEDPRILAGFNAWKSMPVRPEQLEWMADARMAQQNYVPLASPPAAGQQDPPRDEGRAATRKYGVKFLVWGILWLVSAIVYFIVVTRINAGLFGFGAFFGAAVFGLPHVFGGRRAFGKWWTVGYYAFAVVALLVGFVLASAIAGSQPDAVGPSPAPRMVALVAITGLLCVTFWFATRAGNRALVSRKGRPMPAAHTVQSSRTLFDGPLIHPDQIERFRQWGTPGRGLNDFEAIPFSRRNAELGFGGEILTSQLIDPMTVVPGVRIVHGINLPGHGEADIDHVILCGDLLIVVDSKHWPGGNYYWLSEQIMCTTPSGHEHRGNPMSWGLPTLQQCFPDKQLFPVVVIHSHDGGDVATNNRNRGANPILMTPLQFAEQVGRLCVDQQAKTVDGVALSKLVSMMAK